MARYKGQREIKITLAFCVAKKSQDTTKHPNPQGLRIPHAD